MDLFAPVFHYQSPIIPILIRISLTRKSPPPALSAPQKLRRVPFRTPDRPLRLAFTQNPFIPLGIGGSENPLYIVKEFQRNMDKRSQRQHREAQ
jgi:hypothetical protein